MTLIFCSAEGKSSFPTHDAARRAYKRIRKTARGLQIYSCSSCGGWHIGHSKKGAVRCNGR